MKINLCIFEVLIVLICLIWNTDCTENNSQVLSRKRRYLTFPEGSSLQLIYDQTIPIIGIELVFTIGITVALAWELPSEPLYKITQQLRKNLKDRLTTKPSSRIDKIETTLIDTTHRNSNYNGSQVANDYIFSSPPASSSYSTQNSNWNGQSILPMSDKYDYYFNNIAKSKLWTKFNEKNKNDYYYNKANGFGEKDDSEKNKHPFDFTKLITKENQNRLMNVISSFAQKYQTNSLNDGERKPVYPSLGKRKRSNIEEIIEDEESKLFIEHHRDTRKALYKKIESFLRSHKRDGRKCVLKALCETGKRHHEKGKGTFVAEILRAIFSLPKSLKKNSHKRSDSSNFDENYHYDEAHNHVVSKDCEELYPECEDSLWTADFIY